MLIQRAQQTGGVVVTIQARPGSKGESFALTLDEERFLRRRGRLLRRGRLRHGLLELLDDAMHGDERRAVDRAATLRRAMASSSS